MSDNLTPEQVEVLRLVEPWLLDDDVDSYSIEQLRVLFGYKCSSSVYQYLRRHGLPYARRFNRVTVVSRSALIWHILSLQDS